MDLVVNQDIRKLVLGAQKVQKGLDMLEQDREAWAREREENDLAKVIEHLRRLECDVSMMQAHLVSKGLRYQAEGKCHFLDPLHRTFSTLNVLFNDLKKVRTELNEAYICSGDLKKLEVDWSKFTNAIAQIQRYLQGGEDFLKRNDILSSIEEKNAPRGTTWSS